MKLFLKIITVISAALMCVLVLTVIALMTEIDDPKHQVTYKYLIVHHDSICDTIETSGYQYLYREKAVNAKEGGIFTEVRYIKRIE